MSITRAPLAFENQYVQIPNAWLRDKRISRRARGLLAELMTHRIGWKITLQSLSQGEQEGRDAVAKAVKELCDHGYLAKERQHGDNGRFAGWAYELQDPDRAAPAAPESDDPPYTENPNTDKPNTDKPNTANPQLRTTELKNTIDKEHHTDGASPSAGADPSLFDADGYEIEQASNYAKPETAEEEIARRLYDYSRGALNYMGMKQIAKWAMKAHEGITREEVGRAMMNLWSGSRAVTKQTVGQALQGWIRPDGTSSARPAPGTRQNADDRFAATQALKQPEPQQRAPMNRGITA